jgi:DNA invertase Pin-like site-specific DNA recombinase
MRLSEEDRDVFGRKVESGSITSQRHLIMDFIQRQPEFAGCRVIERCDDGISGRHFDTRPQFTDMIELAKKGRINCIIVKDCSRFGRDYVELGDYLEQVFPFLGIRFIAVNDNYDSLKTEGGLDIAFKNLVYDMYSRELSRKMKTARKQLAVQGKYTSSQALYGYRKKKDDKHSLELNEETAPVVREIFDMRLAGMGMKAIARNLNERRIKCPTAYLDSKGEKHVYKGDCGKLCWMEDTVRWVLKNETYTGTVVSSRHRTEGVAGKSKQVPEEEWIRVEDRHEAIVSKEEFARVQAGLPSRETKTTERKPMRYRCGICGKKLQRKPKYGNLFCKRGYFLEKDCECRQVRAQEQEMDAALLDELKRKLMRALDAEELRLENADSTASEADETDSIKNALESVKREKQMLFEKLADRCIDREMFRVRKAEIDAQITGLEQRLENTKISAALAEDAGSGADEARSILDVQEMSEEIWEKFVNDVYLYPGNRMEIRWNFDDGGYMDFNSH